LVNWIFGIEIRIMTQLFFIFFFISLWSIYYECWIVSFIKVELCCFKLVWRYWQWKRMNSWIPMIVIPSSNSSEQPTTLSLMTYSR
jgi:hypothetical protein